MAKTAAIKTLKLDQLRIDGGTQMRVELSEATVKEYTEAYQEAVELPPIRAVYDGSNYWLYDGFTRWHASRRAGIATIKVEVADGTQRDAVLLACGANASHGLKRTNADKRRAVETILNDSEWGKWSDNKIAEAAGVSQQFVSNVRPQLTTVVNSNGKREGKDGKSYPPPKPKKPPKPDVKSPKDQLKEFFGEKPEPEPEEQVESPPDYGICPHCKGKKWTVDEFGAWCSKCNHPHGEPLGDVDESQLPKSGRERSPAKLVDEFLRKHVGPLARGIVVIADINGGKGEQYDIVNDALSAADRGLREMRKGKR